MEQSGRNPWQPIANDAPEEPRKRAKTVAVGCHPLPQGSQEREGVASLAPQEARLLRTQELAELVESTLAASHFAVKRSVARGRHADAGRGWINFASPFAPFGA